MLSDTVAELEADGIIQKKVFDEIPLRVEYNMTEFGKGLLPVLEEMDKWGRTDNPKN